MIKSSGATSYDFIPDCIPHKIKLERGLENEYISLTQIQKQTVKITLEEINGLINLL